MTLREKYKIFEQLLIQLEENYADTFKADIIVFFNDDFTEDNKQLLFLKTKKIITF